jgi:serine/threonine-protein kinase
VASTLNEIGNIAVAQARSAEAEAAFSRMLSIYNEVYPTGHYLTGVALANLASVYMRQEDHARAEPLFRQAIRIYEEKLAPDHLNTGIARIKLGRVLLRQDRVEEAERETMSGYRILTGQADPSVSFLRTAREDLVAIYEALGQPERAAAFRAELAQP